MVGPQLVGLAHVDGGAVGGGDAVADLAGALRRVGRCETWTRRVHHPSGVATGPQCRNRRTAKPLLNWGKLVGPVGLEPATRGCASTAGWRPDPRAILKERQGSERGGSLTVSGAGLTNVTVV